MVKEIKDLQDLETSLCGAVKLLIMGEYILLNKLPDLGEKSGNDFLKALLFKQVEQSEMHYLRLENVLKYLEVNICYDELGSLLAKEESLLLLNNMPADNDYSILQTAFKVVRYKMTGYHAAVQLSEQLQFTFITELLTQNMEEEIDMEGYLSNVTLPCIDKTAVAA